MMSPLQTLRDLGAVVTLEGGRLRGKNLGPEAKAVVAEWRDCILWHFGREALTLWPVGSEYIRSPFATWVSELYDSAGLEGVKRLARAIDDAAGAGDRTKVAAWINGGELLMVAIEFEPKEVNPLAGL